MFYSDDNASDGMMQALFKASVGKELAGGVEETTSGSQYPVKLVPVMLMQGVGKRDGNCIVYDAGEGICIIYTFKQNGVKEDIVFDKPSADVAKLAFNLEMDPMLEARTDAKGNLTGKFFFTV